MKNKLKLLLKENILPRDDNNRWNIVGGWDSLMQKIDEYESNLVEARVMQKIADTEQLLDQKVNYYEDLSYNHPDITIQQASVTFLKDLEDIMSSLLDKKLDRG